MTGSIPDRQEQVVVSDIDRHDESLALRHSEAAGVLEAVPEVVVEIDLVPRAGEHSIDFALRLLAAQTPEEAVTFAAQMFVPRASVWWGHECMRGSASLLSSSDRRWMELAAAWVTDPEESARQRLLDDAMQERDRGPGVWLALAAGWSQGSMAPAGSPSVLPPAHLTGRAVNAAILNVLARADKELRRSLLQSYLSMARDLV